MILTTGPVQGQDAVSSGGAAGVQTGGAAVSSQAGASARAAGGFRGGGAAGAAVGRTAGGAGIIGPGSDAYPGPGFPPGSGQGESSFPFGGLRDGIHQEARGMIDSVRGNSLPPLGSAAGQQDSFQQAMESSRNRFRDNVGTAQHNFRDALNEARDVRSDVREAAQSADRRQALQGARQEFQQGATTARGQFQESLRDAREEFADARRSAQLTRDPDQRSAASILRSQSGLLEPPTTTPRGPDPVATSREMEDHSRVVDPDETGRDDDPLYQRLYEGLEGPFVPPPENPPPPVIPPGEFFPRSPTTPPAPVPTPPTAGELGLTLQANNGALTVTGVNGPLADLGLAEGDIVLALDGQRITGESQLLDQLFDSQNFNSEVTLEVLRDGTFVEYTLVPAEMFESLF